MEFLKKQKTNPMWAWGRVGSVGDGWNKGGAGLLTLTASGWYVGFIDNSLYFYEFKKSSVIKSEKQNLFPHMSSQKSSEYY